MKVKVLNNISFQTFPFSNDMIDVDEVLLDRIGVDKQFDNNGNVIDFIDIEQLRTDREIECFSIINRGKLWYDTLTPVKLEELNNWYIEWLNVTKTMIKPQKLSWL